MMNRHCLRFGGGKQGLVAVPQDATPLIKQLVQHVLSASLEGTGEDDDVDLEREERAIACFLVMCSHIAAIGDDDHRNEIVNELTEAARNIVDAGLFMAGAVRAAAQEH